MSKAMAEPIARVGDESERGTAAGAEFERMVRGVVDYLRKFRPDAVRCKLLIYSPGTDGFDRSTLAVPMACSEASFAGRVIAFLSKFPAEDWVKGRTIAAELDMEHDGGQFKKLMAQLPKDEVLSSPQGYKLRRS